MDFNLNFHPLDNLIKDKTSLWLEALVPFVDYKYKRYLILYIKYKEITAILSALEDISYVESKGFNCKAKSMDDVISGLAGFMPKDFSENIMQMKNMIDMMGVMNSMDGGMSNLNQFSNQQGGNQRPFDSYGGGHHYGAPYENMNNIHNQSAQTDNDLYKNIKSILDQEQ